jgi:hypothetical protein
MQLRTDIMARIWRMAGKREGLFMARTERGHSSKSSTDIIEIPERCPMVALLVPGSWG